MDRFWKSGINPDISTDQMKNRSNGHEAVSQFSIIGLRNKPPQHGIGRAIK